MKSFEEIRSDLIGDGYDSEPLWTAKQVAAKLQLPKKSVYELPIPQVRIGPRRIRYRPSDVRAFVRRRLESP